MLNALVLNLLLTGAATPGQASQEAPPLPEVGIDQKHGETVPLELVFRDEAGRPVILGDFFGKKPVILALVYYRCPRLCSLVLNHLTDGLKKIGYRSGEEFEVVTVSFDAREGSELAAAKKAAYLADYGLAGGGWHFLTGEEKAIKPLAEAMGFRYRFDAERDQFAHVSAIMVLTPSGQIARYLFGLEYSPRELQFAIEDASAQRIGSPLSQPLRMLCFAYDPDSGRYSLAVLRLVRLAAVGTVLFLGCFVWRLRRTEKPATA